MPRQWRLPMSGVSAHAALVVGLDGDGSVLDLGSCSQLCEFCNACFRSDERLKSGRDTFSGTEGVCCKGGKVVLQYPTDPPIFGHEQLYVALSKAMSPESLRF
ncbi:hypothetical protein QVD17_37740 [Tagetes erecta]|uniref:Uncharacterized protein n=1 Tax=Tagetes erecta TaxID=13708 RepID=A0AAD8JWX7_TARER|nr:hypothetical protein QVD17_37740 [Tagetes erecta]